MKGPFLKCAGNDASDRVLSLRYAFTERGNQLPLVLLLFSIKKNPLAWALKSNVAHAGEQQKTRSLAKQKEPRTRITKTKKKIEKAERKGT